MKRETLAVRWTVTLCGLGALGVTPPSRCLRTQLRPGGHLAKLSSEGHPRLRGQWGELSPFRSWGALYAVSKGRGWEVSSRGRRGPRPL